MEPSDSKDILPERKASASSKLEPIKKVRLFNLGNSPTENSPLVTETSVSTLNPTASPFQSILTFDTPDPFFEEDYPSQRFRPEENEEENSYNPYYSPPPTFVPPESPNELNAETQARSTNMRSSSDQEYTGVTLRPGQLGNLTTYGVLGSPASLTNSAPQVANVTQREYTQGDLRAAESLVGLRASQVASSQNPEPKDPAINTTVRNLSNQSRVIDTPFSSDSEIHPSSGVPLNRPDNTFPTTTLPQTSTFTESAAYQGIREWNNSVFDDRWLLKPDEMWKLDSRRASVVTVSPESQYVNRNTPLTESSRPSEPSRQGAGQNLKIDRFNRELEDTKRESHARQGRQGPYYPDRAIWGELPDTLGAYGRLVGVHEDDRLEPCPPEAERLQECVQDLTTGNGVLPSGLPYRADIVRQHFYGRVFGDVKGPPPLGDYEAQNMTEYAGRFISLEALRKELLKHIEDFVTYMISPPGQMVPPKTLPAKMPLETRPDKPYKTRLVEIPLGTYPAQTPFEMRSVDSVHDEETQLAESARGRTFSDQLAAVESHNSSRSKLESLGGDSSTIELPLDQHRSIQHTSTTTRGMASRKTLIDRLRTASQTRSQLQASILAPSQQTIVEKNIAGSDYGRSIPDEGLFDQASTEQAAQHPYSYGAPQPSPYGAPLPQNQFGAYPHQAFMAPGFNGQMPPVQQPWNFHQPSFIAPQHMQYGFPWQPTYAQPTPSYFQQPAVARPDYLPPPMLHSQPFARPPAPGRMAALYARTNAFQTPQTVHRQHSSAFAQIPEWQNRFGIQPAVAPDLPLLPYRGGSDEMYPHPTGAASVRFQRLTRNNSPSLDMLTDEENVPLTETARQTKPAEWGVMKIGNIPYDLTKSLILSFLGPHAKTITPDLGPAIHIIMDRSTGKTMDCYVEFFSTPDARACVNSLNLRPNNANRIGDRAVDVTTSSQDELLKELFPRAKNVRWEAGKPVVMETTEAFNSGFKSFVSAEELGCLVRHAEQPHRSIYTQKCPQRTYESMISLLSKFPWYDVPHYTLATRNQIFAATRTMLHILSINLRKGHISPASAYSNSPGNPNNPNSIYSPVSGYSSPSGFGYGGGPVLTEALLKDLLMAGLNASGFSEKQRWELYEASEYARHHFRVSPMLKYWPFEVLGRKKTVEEDVVELYAGLIANNPSVCPTGGPFGDLSHLKEGIDMESLTMDEVGRMEWKLFEALLPGGVTRELEDEVERLELM